MTDVTNDIEAGEAAVSATSGADDELMSEPVPRARAGGVELTGEGGLRHRAFRAVSMVYGYLHIPRDTYHDGVRSVEVPVGHPREWHRRSRRPGLRQVLPTSVVDEGAW